MRSSFLQISEPTRTNGRSGCSLENRTNVTTRTRTRTQNTKHKTQISGLWFLPIFMRVASRSLARIRGAIYELLFFVYNFYTRPPSSNGYTRRRTGSGVGRLVGLATGDKFHSCAPFVGTWQLCVQFNLWFNWFLEKWPQLETRVGSQTVNQRATCLARRQFGAESGSVGALNSQRPCLRWMIPSDPVTSWLRDAIARGRCGQ